MAWDSAIDTDEGFEEFEEFDAKAYPLPTHNNLLVSRLFRPEIVPLSAEFRSFRRTWAGDHFGLASSTKADAPETWGQDIDVPLRVVGFESEECDAETIELPGAQMFTQEP